jgi:MerR family regulatory protein
VVGGMTFGEVTAMSGFAASALRYYERTGLLPPPARVNGRRRYGHARSGYEPGAHFRDRAGDLGGRPVLGFGQAPDTTAGGCLVEDSVAQDKPSDRQIGRSWSKLSPSLD